MFSNYFVFLLTILSDLQGITLKLSPGSKVALVGPSGGGKVFHYISSFSFPADIR